MNSIENILEPYAELEQSVGRLMKGLFSEMCGMCTACCCRVDICEEAVASPFLALLLRKQGLGESELDDRYGWLDLDGCSLQYGRPPICYAYFCDSLLGRLQDDEARFAARTLGKLMDHIGKEALGERHLVEIMNPDDLGKVSIEMLQHRIEEAHAAFEVIESYLQTGSLSAPDQAILRMIQGVEH